MRYGIWWILQTIHENFRYRRLVFANIKGDDSKRWFERRFICEAEYNVTYVEVPRKTRL